MTDAGEGNSPGGPSEWFWGLIDRLGGVGADDAAIMRLANTLRVNGIGEIDRFERELNSAVAALDGEAHQRLARALVWGDDEYEISRMDVIVQGRPRWLAAVADPNRLRDRSVHDAGDRLSRVAWLARGETDQTDWTEGGFALPTLPNEATFARPRPVYEPGMLDDEALDNWSSIYDRNREAMYREATRGCYREQVTQIPVADVVTQVMLELMVDPPNRSVANWELYLNHLVHQCINQRAYPDLTWDQGGPLVGGVHPTDLERGGQVWAVGQHLLTRGLHRHVERIEPEARAALLHRVVDRESRAKAADALDIRPAEVDRLLDQALAEIRAVLSEEGIFEPAMGEKTAALTPSTMADPRIRHIDDYLRHLAGEQVLFKMPRMTYEPSFSDLLAFDIDFAIVDELWGEPLAPKFVDDPIAQILGLGQR